MLDTVLACDIHTRAGPAFPSWKEWHEVVLGLDKYLFIIWAGSGMQ